MTSSKNYDVVVAESFKKTSRNLSKRHSSLGRVFNKLISSLEEDPEQGTPIGKGCYKIRLNITSKKKGKRGGARVITYVQIVETTVFLLTIYDKSEKESLSDAELADLLNNLP